MAIESRGNILEKALEKEGNRRHGPVHTCVSMSMWSLEAGFPLSRRGVCTPSLLILNALLGPEGRWGRGCCSQCRNPNLVHPGTYVPTNRLHPHATTSPKGMGRRDQVHRKTAGIEFGGCPSTLHELGCTPDSAPTQGQL